MPLASRLLTALSCILLLHSGYSAHEHSLTSPHPLPADIALETVASVCMLCVGIVLGGGTELRPIMWRVWNGLVEREKGAGGFAWLEECPGFLDVRAKREEFSRWAKAGTTTTTTTTTTE